MCDIKIPYHNERQVYGLSKFQIASKYAQTNVDLSLTYVDITGTGPSVVVLIIILEV